MGSIEGLKGESADMRRLLVAVMVLSLLAPTASAGMTITQPSYTTGDWFEYDGWTAAVFAEYEAQMEAESEDFDRLSIVDEVPMRMTVQPSAVSYTHLTLPTKA